MKRANVITIVRDDESFEKAIRRFKRQCEKSQVISDMKKKRHYIKPSDAKRLKKKRAIQAQKRLHEREKVYY